MINSEILRTATSAKKGYVEDAEECLVRAIELLELTLMTSLPEPVLATLPAIRAEIQALAQELASAPAETAVKCRHLYDRLSANSQTAIPTV